MPQEIYNEGRVVGLSAWEIFKRTAEGQGVDPQVLPTEAQWLTSMIGMGSSMILRVPANTSAGIHDYELPTGSNLSAAGVIIANPFLGNCAWDTTNTWATKVLSYSPLIQNTEDANPPVANNNTVPFDPNYYGNADYDDLGTVSNTNTVSNFIKIADGIVFVKNATWVETGSEPFKDINPDFNNSTTVVRLCFSSTTTADMLILLTGFNNKRVLQGLVGFATSDGETPPHSVGGSVDTSLDPDTGIPRNDWVSGGMLGPEIMPWATKIVFSVPNSAYSLSDGITRTIPNDATLDNTYTIAGIHLNKLNSGEVRTNSVIDFDSVILTDYYDNHSFSTTPVITENVETVALGISDNCNSLVAWYPGMTATQILVEAGRATPSNANFFPPALYATQVTTTGVKTLVPVDVAAPGTVKGFATVTEAQNYKQLLPNNYSIYHDTTTNTFSFAIYNVAPENWSGTAKLDYLAEPKAQLTVSGKQTEIISLTDPNTNQEYLMTGAGGDLTTSPLGKFNWDDMLTTLKDNKNIDTLGNTFRQVGAELNASGTAGITNQVITNLGTTKLTLTGTNSVGISTSITNGTHLATLDSGNSIKSGTEFIEFSNGLRLYISNTAGGPAVANVPVGSIGIGW